jgi:hypothetical protein
MFSFLLTDQQRLQEWVYIKLMARSNSFPLPLLSKLKRNIQQKQNSAPIPVKKDIKKVPFSPTPLL